MLIGVNVNPYKAIVSICVLTCVSLCVCGCVTVYMHLCVCMHACFELLSQLSCPMRGS